MAGEASGDLHGGMLVNEIKKLDSSVRFYGVGGSKLKGEGVELLYDFAAFSSMGFIEPILKLRFYRKALREIQDFILRNETGAVILIDFPGFNPDDDLIRDWNGSSLVPDYSFHSPCVPHKLVLCRKVKIDKFVAREKGFYPIIIHVLGVVNPNSPLNE